MFFKSKGRTLAKIVLFSTALALSSFPRVYANEPSMNLYNYEKVSEIKENDVFFKDYVDLIKKITPKVVYTPVLYTKKPTRTEKQKLILQEKGINVEMIDKSDDIEAVWHAICILNKYKDDKEVLRSAFLPSGYFFTENVYLADWLYWNTRFDTFFDDSEINLVRGDRLFTLVKREGLYYYKNKGIGVRAYSLFNDKVGTSLGEALSNYNHMSLKRLQNELKFNTIKVLSSAADGLKVRLNYSNTNVEGILKLEKGKAEFFPSNIAKEEYENLLGERKEFFNFVEKLKSQVR